ncbi:MAG: cysteine--tRNA ligase [Patescibacteria group bacterium]|nr:MAG: cysteine--tRNA ligase [Patescibacteria group bacterium]
MLLYDSLRGKLKEFPEGGSAPVTIYACGPTVYQYASIGNLRTFLTTDLLRRYLEYRGLEVKLVMNITDVGHMLNDADTGEDKMTASAAKEGKTPEEIARFYEEAFFRDLDAVNFKRAWKHPRATEHIPQMVALVEKLLEEGHAYVTEKNDVYFDVASFKDYGKLSGNSVDDLVAGARVEVKDDKKHPADFALWIHNPNHVMQWKGPRGIQGYPGWHLECSAMAKEYLGDTLSLHIGGEDLKFPHHECEIAQSESANHAPFSKHWLHVSFLLVEGEKMSKSKGNTYTLPDLVAKGYSPEAVRFLLLSSQYRTQFNFTFEGLKAAERTLAQMRSVTEQFAGADPVKGAYETRLVEAMDDDMNVSAVLAIVHGFMTEANKGNIDKNEGASFMRAFDGIFGLRLFETKSQQIPDEVQALAQMRAEARANKDWAASDRLRDEIAAKGWVAEDTPQGQKLKKA